MDADKQGLYGAPPQGSMPPTYQQGQPGPYPPQYGAPQPQGYAYPPGYGAVPQQGYEQQYPPNAAILPGGPEAGHHHHHEEAMADESFGHQLSHLFKRSIQAVTRPRAENFRELKRYASWNMVFFMLGLEIVWSIIIELINYYTITVELENSTNSDDFAFNLGATIGVTVAMFLFFFFLGNGIFHGLAQCMAADRHYIEHQPTFLQLCFLNLLYTIPLDILSILGLIPFVGWVISIALLIYRLMLLVYTLQGVYGVSVGQAIGIIVCFVVIIIVGFFVLLFAAGSAIAALITRAN